MSLNLTMYKIILWEEQTISKHCVYTVLDDSFNLDNEKKTMITKSERSVFTFCFRRL